MSETVECCHSVPERGKHCIHCGARFTLRPDGSVEVGPSQEKLLAALWKALMEFEDYDDVNCLWLIRWGLADTAEQAAALWKRRGKRAFEADALPDNNPIAIGAP